VPDQELPRREIRDAQTARAMAHPLRIRLVEQLTFGGPMTATRLSELVGESPANCSWHLRQLAKYGFVEEASGGVGRERPWQVVVQSNNFGPEGIDAETLAASQATVRLWFDREVEALLAWNAREASEGEWAHAAYLNQSTGWLTMDELRAVSQEMQEIMTRFLHRINDPASRPPGARPVRLISWGIPADTI
jgi:hypothetical protein